jgi:hypothetical protein
MAAKGFLFQKGKTKTRTKNTKLNRRDRRAHRGENGQRLKAQGIIKNFLFIRVYPSPIHEAV